MPEQAGASSEHKWREVVISSGNTGDNAALAFQTSFQERKILMHPSLSTAHRTLYALTLAISVLLGLHVKTAIAQTQFPGYTGGAADARLVVMVNEIKPSAQDNFLVYEGIRLP
jgi:hypothetical protein